MKELHHAAKSWNEARHMAVHRRTGHLTCRKNLMPRNHASGCSEDRGGKQPCAQGTTISTHSCSLASKIQLAIPAARPGCGGCKGGRELCTRWPDSHFPCIALSHHAVCACISVEHSPAWAAVPAAPTTASTPFLGMVRAESPPCGAHTSPREPWPRPHLKRPKTPAPRCRTW